MAERGRENVPLDGRPNILFIMSGDHAAASIGCYGSGLNRTPHLERIAEQGMRFDRCFAVDSICTASRATILTGTIEVKTFVSRA